MEISVGQSQHLHFQEIFVKTRIVGKYRDKKQRLNLIYLFALSFDKILSQLTFICSKSTVKTSEQYMKTVQS